MPTYPTETSSGDYTPQGPESRKNILELFPPYQGKKSELAEYRLLAPSAGVRVSPICLGAMSIGDQWTGFMGTPMGYEKSEKFLDTFYELGGNFIDTANNYQDEQSEHIIGEWMEKRGIREEIVLATKYTSYHMDRAGQAFDGIRVNFVGNSRKALHFSVERSLKKLRTSYIDILYLHWWDYTTPIPEVMNSLNDLVKAGKVHYLGVSDTPAWIVSQANEYARQNNLAQFVIYQGAWNLLMRDMERDIIPMCRTNGMSITPYSVMGGGMFRSPEELKKRGESFRGGMQPSEAQLRIAGVLQEIAQEIGGGVTLANVALAWSRQTMADCFPVIGGGNPDHLRSNVEALKIRLTDAQMDKLNQAAPFDYGFPFAGFGRDPRDLPGGKPNSRSLNNVASLTFNTRP